VANPPQGASVADDSVTSAKLGAGAGTGPATKLVAASDSDSDAKNRADYVCDGTSDETEINNALNALPSAGGVVRLAEGTYTIDGAITIPASNVALVGSGSGTVIRVANNLNPALLYMVRASGRNNVLVTNIQLDGNKANNATGTIYGIYFDSATTNSRVVDCWVHDMTKDGVLLSSSDNNIVADNHSYDNDQMGINLASSDSNIVVNNIVKSNLSGIRLHTCENNTVKGNTCHSNDRYGICLESADSHNSIDGNMVVGNSQEADNTYDGIFVDSSSNYNNLVGNMVRHGGGTKQHRYGINISADTCTLNLVQNNDLYQAGRTANFHDAGTNTKLWDKREGSTVEDADLASGVGLSDSQICKLPTASEGQFLRRGAVAWEPAGVLRATEAQLHRMSELGVTEATVIDRKYVPASSYLNTPMKIYLRADIRNNGGYSSTLRATFSDAIASVTSSSTTYETLSDITDVPTLADGDFTLEVSAVGGATCYVRNVSALLMGVV